MNESRWSGWLGFAAWLMVTIGALYIIQGLIAIIRKQYYVLGTDQIIVFDLTKWGWIMIIVGVITIFASFGVFRGAQWARGAPARDPATRVRTPTAEELPCRVSRPPSYAR